MRGNRELPPKFVSKKDQRNPRTVRDISQSDTVSQEKNKGKRNPNEGTVVKSTTE